MPGLMKTIDAPARWPTDPPKDCTVCKRLVDFRTQNQTVEPSWFNGAVGTVGDPKARLLIVGLAPGLKGANKTGRPFFGDSSGDLLYTTLIKLDLASGVGGRVPGDGLRLKLCAITNAVRCVPPANKPIASEINACSRFLETTLKSPPNLRAILVLGRIAHDAVVRTMGQKPRDVPFAHGGQYQLPNGLQLVASYHCSRYNTNTGRLTKPMFESAVHCAKTAAQI